METRKLGYWETYQALKHDYFYGTGIVVSVNGILGKIDHQLFRDTLFLLYKRHPLLRASLEERKKENNDGYYFLLNVPFSQIPIQFRKRTDEKHWERIAEEELNALFPTSKYLWKVILLSDSNDNNELFFIFHHSMIDWLSCVNLLVEFLEHYQKLASGQIIEVKSLPFLKNVESYLTSTLSWEEKKRKIQFANEQLRELTPFPYEDFQPLGKRITKNLYFTILPHQFSLLKEKCRLKKVKINSALNAFLLLSIQKMKNESISIALNAPINLRKFCVPPIEAEHAGSYLSDISNVFTDINSNDDVWQLSLIYENKLMSSLKSGVFSPREFDFAELKELVCSSLEKASSKRNFPSIFMLSNVGNFDLQEIYGPLRLTSHYVTVSRHGGEFVLKLGVMSMHNKMFLCFSYSYPLISSDWARILAENYLKILNHTINSI